MSSADCRQIVAEGYDRIADVYLAWSSDPTLRNAWLDRLCQRLPAGGRILDLGCGAGIPVARRLAAEGYRVLGVDGSAAQIERARRNVPLGEFAVADMMSVAFEPGSFDAVVALYSIAHVPREKHATLFRRIGTWLKPGGIFLATLGAGDAPDWSGEWLGTTMFFSHFDAVTNRRLLEGAGFTLDCAAIVREWEDGDPVEFLWVIGCTPV